MDAHIDHHETHPVTGEALPGHYLFVEDVVLGPYDSIAAAKKAFEALVADQLSDLVKIHLGLK